MGRWVYFGNAVKPAWDFRADWKRWGFRTACANFRFNTAYWLGGFTSAKRDV